jgi:hypothetical protein
MSEGSSPEFGKPDPHEAVFREYTRQQLHLNARRLIRGMVPREFGIGSLEKLGDVRYRFCSLPEDDEGLQARLKNIRANGTDRTDPTFSSKFENLYTSALNQAKEMGLNVVSTDIMDTMGAMDFFRSVERGLDPTEEYYGGSNGILIYDDKTEKGIIRIFGPEYTFKDLSRRNEALLGIIRLK